MLQRLQELRRALKLNQIQFGAEIGVGQSAIYRIECGKNELTERNFNAICAKFNVNPEWLREGKGEMFNPLPATDPFEALVQEKQMTPIEAGMIKALLSVPPETRKAVNDYLLTLAEIIAEEQLKPKDKKRAELLKQRAEIDEQLALLDGVSDDELSRKEKHALLDAELDAAEKGETFTRSTFLNGRIKKNKRLP